MMKRLRFPNAAPEPDIRTLEFDDVPLLRLTRTSEIEDALAALEAMPGRSVWCPDSLEYVLASPWRHRPEIVNLSNLAAIRHTEALIRASADRSRELGDALTLVLDLDEERPAGFYRRAELDLIERILTYELRRSSSHEREQVDYTLRFVRAHPDEPEQLAALIDVDQQAFPWLWWNSTEEFFHYADQPGVEIYLGFDGDRAVSYCGFTLFRGWAHLDRIAVLPNMQRRGLGRATLAFTVNEVFQRQVDRIGLSTQEQNIRSRKLYEGFGFRRSPGYDYGLHGIAHRDPAFELISGTTPH